MKEIIKKNKSLVIVAGLSLALMIGVVIAYPYIDAALPASSMAGSGGAYTLQNANLTETLKFEEDVVITLVGENKIIAEDDGINGKGSITIQGDGSLIIESGDDGIHADVDLIINSGNITVTKCVEGLEGQTITINGGNIDIVSSDDGMNASGDDTSKEISIVINGGYIKIDAQGDGIDSNGSLLVAGGEIHLVQANPMMNEPLDYATSFSQTGGTIYVADEIIDGNTYVPMMGGGRGGWNGGGTFPMPSDGGNWPQGGMPTGEFPGGEFPGGGVRPSPGAGGNWEQGTMPSPGGGGRGNRVPQ